MLIDDDDDVDDHDDVDHDDVDDDDDVGNRSSQLSNTNLPYQQPVGLRVVAAPSLYISLLGPGGEPAVAVCGVNCRRWQPRGLHEGTVPSRGLTVRLRRSDAETKKQQQQEQHQASAATVSGGLKKQNRR